MCCCTRPSSVLLFLVLLRMTGDLWPSAWVAAVFAIHPLHVESVAWVAERRDVLSGLFFMLTLGAYALYAERPSLPRYLAVAGLFHAGADGQADARHGSVSPVAARLLAARPLCSAAGASPRPASGSWLGRLPVGWRLVVEKIPLVALAAAGCGIVLLTHSSMESGDLASGFRWRHAWPMPWFRTPLTWASLSIPPIWRSFIRISVPACRSPGWPDALVLLLAITAVAAYCLAPAALFDRRLAVVFGNAGAGHRIGAVRRSCQGRPLHLSESDRFVDCVGLGRVELLSIAAISSSGAVATMDARGGIGRVSIAAGRHRVASNFLLAQCRNALEACARLHRAECNGSLQPCRRLWTAGETPSEAIASFAKRWRPV